MLLYQIFDDLLSLELLLRTVMCVSYRRYSTLHAHNTSGNWNRERVFGQEMQKLLSRFSEFENLIVNERFSRNH